MLCPATARRTLRHPQFVPLPISFFFFFNDTATTEIYTLSLHDALPISYTCRPSRAVDNRCSETASRTGGTRSEEHTSELQSPCNLVCRLLLEKKKKQHELHPVILVRHRGDSPVRAAPSAHH